MSAGEYFATLAGAASAADHQAIRARGAEVAAAGHAELQRTLVQRLESLEPRLRSLHANQLLVVTGAKTMRLDDYLATRIVEQVVHIDDLARSVGVDPWTMPAGASELTIALGVDTALHRGSGAALVRALYRRGFAEALLPVL